MLKRCVLVSCISLLALLGACSTPGGGNEPQPGEPVTVRLDADGGVVEAEAGDGTLFRLDVPVGALRSELDLTVTPGAAPADGLASFGIEPLGLGFAAPVTVSVTLPPGTALPADAVLALGPATDRTFVPTTVDTASARLSTEVTLLGFTPDLALQAAGTGRAQARNAHATGSLAAGIGPAQADGDTVAAVIADCQTRLASAQQILQGLLATDSYRQAVRFIYATSELAANCTLLEESQEWLAQVPAIGCDRYADLTLLARTSAADGYGIFNELITPLLAWTAALWSNGVDSCEGEPTWEEVYQEKVEQLLIFVNDKIATAYEGEFDELLVEAVRLWRLRQQAFFLGLPGAESLIETTALYPVMVPLREKGYELCGLQDTHFYLASLLEKEFISRKVTVPTGAATALAPVSSGRSPAGLATSSLSPLDDHAPYKDADLHVDMQYCASSMELHVWAEPDVPREVVERSVEIVGGTGPGEFTATAATLAPIEGHVVLDGHVAQFRCGTAGTAADPLAFRFESREVDRAEASGDTLMSSPTELTMRELSDLAAFDPNLLNTGELVVRREGSACDGLFGDAPFDLFTIDLAIDPAPTLNGVTASAGQITAEQGTPVTFTLPFRDEGTNLTRLAVRYELGSNQQNFELDLTGSAEASGFDVAQGSGSYTPIVTIFCSEAGKNPLKVTLSLLDEFSQESAEVSTSVNIDYGGCDSAAEIANGASAGVNRHAGSTGFGVEHDR